jgi:hypothetical protein
MGNRPLCKIIRIHMLGTPESEELRVTALNPFYPAASPLLQNVSFLIVTQPPKERGIEYIILMRRGSPLGMGPQ